MSKPIYILGTGLSHDGSSCLMKDGEIVVAIEKERITRRKHDGYNDDLTIKYCLDAEGITFSDLSLVVEKNTVNLAHDAEAEKMKANRIIPKDIPRVTISHHLAHAYSVIGTSPFDDMGIVVMDGRGASLDNCIDVTPDCLPVELQELKKKEYCHYFENQSYYVYENHELNPILKDYGRYEIKDREIYPLAPNDMDNSIAELYGGASHYVFGSDFNEGKLMGLAPYGREDVFKGNLFILKNNRVFINYDEVSKVNPKKSHKYVDFWDNFQYYADLAKWVQKESEKAIYYLFNSYYDMHPMKNVGYVGGLALNAVANGKLPKKTKFDNFYFQPAAGDNGLAIGCCYYGWLEVLKKEKILHSNSTYFGKTYGNNEIEKALCEYSDELEIVKTEDYIGETAMQIANGKVVAWFQDGSEFGPRALGHRSILASPLIPEMRDYINKEIKLREEFRPFAPSVLIENLKEYFDLDFDTSYYMILVGQTKDKWIEKIPSVVHVDKSARIQTVTKELSPKYYALIDKYKQLTGIPILINTSFNKRGMPIVEKPKEAIDFFVHSRIDILVIQDYIIKKVERKSK